MKKYISLILAAFLCLSLCNLQAQSCGAVDCKGACGRFVDQDKDGFCDNGHLSQKPTPTPEKTKPVASQQNCPKSENVQLSADTMQNNSIVDSATITIDSLKSTKEETVESETSGNQSRYHLIPILLGLTIAYAITFILVKCNKLKKINHRKIWNVILAITFLVSGLLGLLLAIFIQYHYFPTWYGDILLYHVDFGIGMTFVAFFHLIWHWKYYKMLICKQKGVSK